MKPRSKILIIAGSDSSGGAGIQADMKTVTALGSYAMTAVTAITVQNTTGVKSVIPLNPNAIAKQILFTCKDIKPDAVKIGMLHSSDVISTVVNSLKKNSTKYLIVDPVMVSKSGARLIDTKAISILKKKLLVKSFLVTPNIPEAEVLTKLKIKNLSDMVKAGKVLLKLGAKNVLIKGGHSKSNYIQDIFLSKKKYEVFNHKRINTKNTHGTGCTLSSAIATYLSCGKPINKACELGIKYVNHAIRSNLNYGKGHGPINHLNSFNLKRKFL